jgi:hypothetical protein|tara:strand:- start:524 stop:751 length:228 start_codon:yes stop_codon:yes gene_type:complete
MPDIKTFYPGSSASNPINNATDAVSATSATTATTATIGNSVDDQNQTSNALIWTGTAAQYAAVNPKDANTLYFVV